MRKQGDSVWLKRRWEEEERASDSVSDGSLRRSKTKLLILEGPFLISQ